MNLGKVQYYCFVFSSKPVFKIMMLHSNELSPKGDTTIIYF